MSQQLPLIQIPMPARQQGYNLPPMQRPMDQLQPDSTVPAFVNDPNIPIEQKRAMLGMLPVGEYQNTEYIPPDDNLPQPRQNVVMSDGHRDNTVNGQNVGYHEQQPIMNAQPQVVADVSPQSMAIAGAGKQGVDWRGALATLGSYLSATGQGMAGQPNLSAGLAKGMGGALQNAQNIRQYQTMAPQFQQMGYDVSRLDPRRGGAGITTTPESLIDLQSKIAERNYLNDYRQTLAEARLQQAQQKQQSTPTIGDLMLYNPEFKAMMEKQYNFTGGQNQAIKDRPAPTALLQNIMPKNVNMKYTGGLNSSKNVNVTNT